MFDSSILVKKMWTLKRWCVTKVAHCKGIILQRNYRKMTISWSFFYMFVKCYDKTFWSHMTVLYQNPCYTEVCYKGTAFYSFFYSALTPITDSRNMVTCWVINVHLSSLNLSWYTTGTRFQTSSKLTKLPSVKKKYHNILQNQNNQISSMTRNATMTDQPTAP